MKAIMMYHSLDHSGSVISLDPDMFARHVRWFASGRVRVVPLEHLASDTGAGDIVSLTFDDAFANFASVAAPQLAEHDLPATVFVVSGRTGGTNAWGDLEDLRIPTLPLLNWDAIGDLARDGITIGGHTRSHPWLGSLSETQLADEIAGCADDIQKHLGLRPATFAYPYGDTSTSATQCVREQYAYACTTQLRVFGAEEDPALLPRLDAYYFRTPGMLESWGSPSFTSFLRRRSFARRVRSRLRDGLRGTRKLA